MGRNGEESVEKKCTSNLDTGLIRGIILMIIPLSSPLDFVLVARNQIRITGAFFLTDSSTVSNHRKQNLLVPALLYSTGGRLEAAPVMGWVRVEEMTGGRNNRILGEELLKIKSLPAHRHKGLRFLWVEMVKSP